MVNKNNGGSANKRRSNGTNNRKKAPESYIDMRILIPILLICAVIIGFIAIKSCDDDSPDETDGSGVATDSTEADTSDSEKKTGEKNTDTDKADESEDDTTEPAIDETEPGYSVETEVETSQIGDGDISMQYPKIEPTDDKRIDSELINELIRDYMDLKFKNEHIDSGDVGLDGNYEYEITSTNLTLQTADFLSVVVKGIYYIKDTAHPTVFAYTLNCDLKTNEIVDSEALLIDFDSIKEKFTDGKFKLTDGADDLLQETNYSDMIIEYRSDYGIYPDVYFTKDSFGMCIDLVYTLGGYALFEIDINEVADCVIIP